MFSRQLVDLECLDSIKTWGTICLQEIYYVVDSGARLFQHIRIHLITFSMAEKCCLIELGCMAPTPRKHGESGKRQKTTTTTTTTHQCKTSVQYQCTLSNDLFKSALWMITLVKKTTGSPLECFQKSSVHKVTVGWLTHAPLSSREIYWVKLSKQFLLRKWDRVGVYNHIWFCNLVSLSYKYSFWQNIFTKLKFISFWKVGRRLEKWERIVLNLLQ